MIRLYGWLLRLLPPDLRRRVGADMLGLVRDLQREGTLTPASSGALFWDLVQQAAGAWWEVVRDSVGTTTNRRVEEPMKTLLADAFHGFRRILKQPGFSLTVIALVAVGIAGNAAVFRLANGLFLRPLPFPEADRLVDLDETAPAWNLEYVSVSIADFRLWNRENETFESMVAFRSRGGNLVTDGVPSRVSLLAATHDADEVLGIEPLLGRFYTPEEDVPDVPLVALLTEDFWESAFGSDPDVVGRTVELGRQTVEIIGVLPAEVEFLADVDLWVPLQEDDQSSYYLAGIGRLREGVSIERAQADLLAVHRSVVAERQENAVTSPTVEGLRDRYLGEFRLGTGVLLGVVALVLLIACGNIAGLMIAQSIGRRPEIAVRRALGAGRGRLVAQLLTESLLLAGIGAVAGAALGIWGSGRFLEVIAPQFPEWVSFDLDARFVVFAGALTLGATLLFGLTPALRGTRVSAASVATSGRTTASRRTRRLLAMLVTGEVAAASALLVVAGLSLRDARAVGRLDPGFDASALATFRVQLDVTRYPDAEARRLFADDYQARLAGLPGVDDVVVSTNLPLMGHSGWFFQVEGHERPEGELGPVVLRRWVTPGYLEAMGLELVQGRALTVSDGRTEGEQVVVVNESFVRSHVPAGESPLGQRIHTGGDDPMLYTVVGVVRDVKHYGLDEDMRPGTYEPLAQGNAGFLQVAVRARPGADPLSIVPAVRSASAELDPGLPIYDVQTMGERIDASLLGRRSLTTLFSVFSAIALFLAVAGLYGVISYTVGQRAGEISVRMALGAPGTRVAREVVRQGMAMVAVGLALGLGLAWSVGGTLSGLLVGGRATDLSVYAAVAGLLLAVAFVANWVPARRAAGVNPMQSLRGE